jgi:hypothetical protein
MLLRPSGVLLRVGPNCATAISPLPPSASFFFRRRPDRATPLAMRRLSICLCLLVALTACADAPQPSMPEQAVTASFPRGGIANLIRVDALDTLPLRSAELVAPDGTTTASTYLNVNKMPETTNGEATLNDPWRSSMLGTNGIPQQANVPLAAAYRSKQTLLLMVSVAEIPLPDPEAYRRDWAHYRIRVTLGDASDTREISAPQPPPG